MFATNRNTMSALNFTHGVTDRFLRYVKIDTQSDPTSNTYPTTEKQKDLGRVLVEELKAIGITDAELNDFGVIYATIPSNTSKEVPVLCFCSHMDTSPDSSGTNVKPLIHHNYQGNDLVLPDDNTQVISPKDHLDLLSQIGNDIITASGTTLLGADNKSGLAAIMDAAEYLMKNPQIKHGKIRILFTPDEEVGKGVDNVDLKKLGADFAYTVDGETLGSIENETFSADGATITVKGVSTHPGFAKGKLVNAIKIAGEILDALPKDSLSPETTEKREGFIHPVSIQGIAELATINFILRDFDDKALEEIGHTLKAIVDKVMVNHPNASAEVKIKEQYRNMKKVLDQHPQVTENAVAAIKRAGLTPKPQSIRGGTDGSRLSLMGLPCPNLFAGEHAFHSRHEWVSVQDMEKASETLVHLAMIWEENS